MAPKDAIATAKKEAKDGTVHGIELDFDERDKAWQYEVKVIDGATDFDVEIDAETGEVVDTEKDSSDDKEKAIDLNDPMTFDEALKLAQERPRADLTDGSSNPTTAVSNTSSILMTRVKRSRYPSTSNRRRSPSTTDRCRILITPVPHPEHHHDRWALSGRNIAA
ncbi:PepSY domain-containing protein [Brevibacterium sp. UCMA 11754]|uniref:PepSY domain-containing protein n=1 Tax=Brevibacterium sp. UCMA 11754 TaxID=2749198 RepID=UPI001F455185|nr:PepSY domain-containing protein [Brevibacterium sp. UCMA 11754]MCF2574133.1 PepSY domain-containing protein [Brevibacterium sp. UCMA 11754]